MNTEMVFVIVLAILLLAETMTLIVLGLWLKAVEDKLDEFDIKLRENKWINFK